jgi:hypothetical protein
MDRSEAEIARLSAWRRQEHLALEHTGHIKRYTPEPPPTPNFQFFCYDPSVGVGDMSSLNVRGANNTDKAIFSIPVDFTRENRTQYRQHDHTEFGFDIRSVLTRNNAPIYPLRK